MHVLNLKKGDMVHVHGIPCTVLADVDLSSATDIQAERSQPACSPSPLADNHDPGLRELKRISAWLEIIATAGYKRPPTLRWDDEQRRFVREESEPASGSQSP